MVEVVKSATFDRWLRKFKDRRAAARVLVRIDRLVAGNPGDVKPAGSGISDCGSTTARATGSTTCARAND